MPQSQLQLTFIHQLEEFRLLNQNQLYFVNKSCSNKRSSNLLTREYQLTFKEQTRLITPNMKRGFSRFENHSFILTELSPESAKNIIPQQETQKRKSFQKIDPIRTDEVISTHSPFLDSQSEFLSQSRGIHVSSINRDRTNQQENLIMVNQQMISLYTSQLFGQRRVNSLRQVLKTTRRLLTILNGSYLRLFNIYLQDSMAPQAAISYTAIVLGLAFYYVAISALVSTRTATVDREVIFEGIDKNKDGKLSSKEVKEFNPCNTDFDKLTNRLKRMGNKITMKRFNNQISDTLIKKTLTECVSETKTLINPAKLWKRDLDDVTKQFFNVYDLNKDGVISFKEYYSINSYNKKPLDNERETFAFFDRNMDWRITAKEFAKAKLQKLKPKKA